jgi:hypothetical protein
MTNHDLTKITAEALGVRSETPSRPLVAPERSDDAIPRSGEDWPPNDSGISRCRKPNEVA